MVVTGLEKIIHHPPQELYRRRFALLCHQASITRDFSSAWIELKKRFPKNLVLLFSPQHGLFAEKQANMIDSFDTKEPETSLPIVSLYGPRLAPEKEHLQEIDLLLIDLQDVGCRVYTYIWTMFLTLKACAREGIEVWILDRPNPLGRKTEGPILEEELTSFVGLVSLPMRHGLTMGELALYFKEKEGLDLDLRVVSLENWDPSLSYPQTSLPWLPPSPNMPSWETARVYPGQVILEGTNLSEGRGTTKPFELFGAPWLKVLEIKKILPPLPGVVLKVVTFEPWFDKWAGRRCYGFYLLVKDENVYQPVATTLTILATIASFHEEFAFRRPPYEFEWQKMPFDIIVGKKNGRELLSRLDWFEECQKGLDKFEEEVQPFKLY